MRPELEQITIKDNKQSFHFFKRSATSFLPFWHYHPELELTLITRGRGTRFIGDSIESFSSLDLILVGENLPHHWVSAAKTKDQEALIFQFSKTLFDGFIECEVFKSLFEIARQGIYFSKPSEELINKITTFERLTSIEKLSSFIEILSMLQNDKNRITLASENYLKRPYRDSSQTKISKTTNYILEHLEEKLSVNMMSEITHMTPQSFCRWFKKHSGHSFISFLNLARVERVCHLLHNSNMSIQEIAFSCGFESLSHFNRTFKATKDFSPREFRKSILI